MKPEELEQLQKIQEKYEQALTEVTQDNYKETHEKYFQVSTFGSKGNGLVKEHYKKLTLTLVLDEHYRKINAMLEDRWDWKEKPIPEEKKMNEMLKMWDELIERTWDFYVNPCQYRTNDDPNRHFCEKKCEECISKKHWTDIINNKPHHFVTKDNKVYFISEVGRGGFYDKTFTIRIEDGEPFQCGLWHNGTCTDQVARQIPDGQILN